MNIIHDIFCNWQPIANTDQKKYKCNTCNKVITIIDDYEYPPQMICSKTAKLSENNDTISEDLKNFVLTTVNQESQFCSEQETNIRYAKCRACEFFHANTCQKCGCLISRDKVFASKLIIKNEHCPIDKW